MRVRMMLVAAIVVMASMIGIAACGSSPSSSVNPQPTSAGTAAATTAATTAPTTTCSAATPSSTADLHTFKIVPAQTTASYTVKEDLIIQNLPHNTAIGKTHDVQGSFLIRSGASPLVASMKITVNLSTLQSDSGQRDHYVQQNYLETDTYPTATFESICAEGLPANYTDGQTAHFQMLGNLTVHGKTNKETFDVQGKLSGNTISGTATCAVKMSDFGISPPNIANFVVAEDKTLITIDFTAQEG